MTTRKDLDPAAVAVAFELFMAWEPWAAMVRESGIPETTLRRHAEREGWVRPERTAEQEAAAAAAHVVPANEARLERWAQRRAREADEAGNAAAGVRAAGEKAVDEDNPQMVRACGIFYGILIDKAQLLSGGATGRVDSATPAERRQRVASMQDDLAQRRAHRDEPVLPEAQTG